ncbi:MAG: hypothetical protein ACK4JY_03445 [Brevundimonas sp.]|uniref:hypothetical protein n=1 Tax=Brevundimonas sp. TaxID=1871086 RepID=UPI00391C3821
MTTTEREPYLRASGLDQATIDYFLGMPAWMYVPWTLGVWGALGQVIDPPPLPANMAMMRYMPWVIALIAAFLAWYAWTMAKKGVLR